jgi:plasmid maintenance system antidote protein VapI
MLFRLLRRRKYLKDKSTRFRAVESKHQIIIKYRGVTADTALRLARCFGTTAELWTGLQADYELRLARYEREKQIQRDVKPLGVATLLAA